MNHRVVQIMIKKMHHDNNQRGLSMIGVVLFLILTLTGCGGGGGGESSGGETNIAPAEVTPKAVTVISGRA